MESVDIISTTVVLVVFTRIFLVYWMILVVFSVRFVVVSLKGLKVVRTAEEHSMVVDKYLSDWYLHTAYAELLQFSCTIVWLCPLIVLHISGLCPLFSHIVFESVKLETKSISSRACESYWNKTDEYSFKSHTLYAVE